MVCSGKGSGSYHATHLSSRSCFCGSARSNDATNDRSCDLQVDAVVLQILLAVLGILFAVVGIHLCTLGTCIAALQMLAAVMVMLAA